MNCENCGAPMVLHAENHYFHCEYCGAYHFPSASPDGIRILGEAPEHLLCPVCRISLSVSVVDDRHRVHVCPNCRGLLLNREAFRVALQARRAAALTPPALPQPLGQVELERTIDCPQCRQPMATHPYLGPGNIVIDTCTTCNLIWLDYGEISRAADAPGRDRDAVRRERERLAAEASEEEDKADHRSHKRRHEHRHAIDLLDFLEDLLGD